MHILQISAPKSGSYWLHSILQKVLKKNNLPLRSFIQQQPIYEQLKQKPLSFKNQASVDMLDIEDEGYFYRVSSVFREPVPDITEYVASTSLAWTHSTYCGSSENMLRLFDKRVYIIRDPRDRALSSSKFAFTPYMKKHYPTSYSSPEDYLKGEYERLLEQWVWHVGNYLRQKEALDIHFIFYERLLSDFENELKRLLDYLKLPLAEEDQKELAREVHFTNMKDASPGHLQKGKSGKWIEKLDRSQKRRALDKTGALLNLLHYPLKETDASQLPYLPSSIDGPWLNDLLAQMDWRYLFPAEV